MMTTDRERLEEMLKELPEAKSYFNRNVFVALMEHIDENTGNLRESLYIVGKDVDDTFLRNVLEVKLGYKAEYEDDYNPYHECYCYKIQIKR